MIMETVSKLVGRFEKLKGTGTVIRLDHAFAASSGDVIGNLCCVEHVNFLDDEDFSPEWCVHECYLILWLYADYIEGSICYTALFSRFPFLQDFHKLFCTLNVPEFHDNIDRIIAS